MVVCPIDALTSCNILLYFMIVVISIVNISELHSLFYLTFYSSDCHISV
uniref:Uncharacterized protein n=1 Tax=Ascaris lumbricoides TaxID=6252 RepID=A0A0M3IWZ8_ASCLU